MKTNKKVTARDDGDSSGLFQERNHLKAMVSSPVVMHGMTGTEKRKLEHRRIEVEPWCQEDSSESEIARIQIQSILKEHS